MLRKAWTVAYVRGADGRLRGPFNELRPIASLDLRERERQVTDVAHRVVVRFSRCVSVRRRAGDAPRGAGHDPVGHWSPSFYQRVQSACVADLRCSHVGRTDRSCLRTACRQIRQRRRIGQPNVWRSLSCSLCCSCLQHACWQVGPGRSLRSTLALANHSRTSESCFSAMRSRVTASTATAGRRTSHGDKPRGS